MSFGVPSFMVLSARASGGRGRGPAPWRGGGEVGGCPGTEPSERATFVATARLPRLEDREAIWR